MLSSLIISKVQDSFVKKCIVLVGQAYDKLLTSGSVNHDMNENTVSENLRVLMDQDSYSSRHKINIAREQPINNRLLAATETANSLPRIDFKFQTSWSMMQKTFEFFMEAKNLYANDFTKTGKSSVTSAKVNHKRYVETGMIHLLNGYYPPNTYLLGYVLEGAVMDAVTGVNSQVTSMLSNADILKSIQPSLDPLLQTYVSKHSSNKMITHLMLQF